nr:circumsporozoite protein-like [Aegilops tauschii subsp. strangulata]
MKRDGEIRAWGHLFGCGDGWISSTRADPGRISPDPAGDGDGVPAARWAALERREQGRRSGTGVPATRRGGGGHELGRRRPGQRRAWRRAPQAAAGAARRSTEAGGAREARAASHGRARVPEAAGRRTGPEGPCAGHGGPAGEARRRGRATGDVAVREWLRRRIGDVAGVDWSK